MDINVIQYLEVAYEGFFIANITLVRPSGAIMPKSTLEVGKEYESLVRYRLEKHRWMVFEPRGLESTHVDLIAAKWIDERLILRAIQVKARTGLGDRKRYFDFQFRHVDENYFYAIVYDSEDEKNLHIWLIPSCAVAKKDVTIHVDDFQEFKGEKGFENLQLPYNKK